MLDVMNKTQNQRLLAPERGEPERSAGEPNGGADNRAPDPEVLAKPKRRRFTAAYKAQGATYVHNLIAGRVHVIIGERRLTPHLEAHATDVAGLAPNPSGDERYYNNIFVNGGLASYDAAKLPVFMDGNLFLNGAKPSKHEPNSLVQPKINPELKLEQRSDGWRLQMKFNKTWADHKGPLVTTEMLGKAKTLDLPYEHPDGKPYRIDTDYFGNKRNTRNPHPGPFNEPNEGKQLIKVWARE